MLLLLQWHRSACSDPGAICVGVTKSKSELCLLWGTFLPRTASLNQSPCWVTHAATNSARSAQRVFFPVNLAFQPHHWWKGDYAAHLHQTELSSIPENSLVCNRSLFALIWHKKPIACRGCGKMPAVYSYHTLGWEKQNSFHFSADILILNHCKLQWLLFCGVQTLASAYSQRRKGRGARLCL